MYKFAAYGGTCFKNINEREGMGRTVLYVLGDMPKLLCLTGLVIKFAYNIFMTFKKRSEKKQQGKVGFILSIYYPYDLAIYTCGCTLRTQLAKM